MRSIERVRCVAAAAVLVAVGGGLLAPEASAQSATEFYSKTKQLTMVVGSAAGGGYDGYARLVARYMTKYLPGNPLFVIQNMPGAGGVIAANYVANVAPKDGTVISIMDRGLPTAPLLYAETSKTQFEAAELSWIGNAQAESGMGVFSTSSPAMTVEQAKKVEVVIGASGPETDPAMFGRLFNELFATKFKVIAAYKGQPETVLAVEKGELHGLFMSGWGGPTSSQLMDMHRAGKVGFMVQMSRKADPQVGNTPLIMDLLSNEADKQMVDFVLSRLELGRPFVGPAGIPADRVAMLRDAFMKACSDPEMLVEAEKQQRIVAPTNGADAQEKIQRMYATPKPVLERLQKVVRLDQ